MLAHAILVSAQVQIPFLFVWGLGTGLDKNYQRAFMTVREQNPPVSFAGAVQWAEVVKQIKQDLSHSNALVTRGVREDKPRTSVEHERCLRGCSLRLCVQFTLGFTEADWVCWSAGGDR